MGKGQYFTPHQKSIVNRYYQHLDTMTLQKLSEAVSDLYLAESPAKTQRLWETVRRLLARATDDPRVANILGKRDVGQLAQLVNDINAGKTAPEAPPEVAPEVAPQPPQPQESPATPAEGDIAPETLKAALKAFKKRLKLSRLDEESQLGRSPMTGGSRSAIVAIQPPNQYPRAVWDELVRQGRLRESGRGFYQLV